jgi:hypothetical protein
LSRQKTFLLLAVLLCGLKLWAQPNFRLEIEELTWPQVPAIHSFACAEYDGKWLFIGGRTNGLHGFLPPFAFPNSGRNPDISVFDPNSGMRWDLPIAGLPDSIAEPLLSSNMLFVQRDSLLYMVGGYGWKASAGTFVTFPTLTVVRIPGLMNAVQNSQSPGPYFKQVLNDSLAVCGAHLAALDSTFLLVFGHRFDGIYDRQDTTGFHIQKYTHAIREFKVIDPLGNPSISWLGETVDSLNFRRRDYNLVAQVFPDGTRGHTAFSGVFQKGINLPYLFPIDVWKDSSRARLNFDQRLANYHCAVLPLHDSTANKMHTVFFGGQAQYRYDSLGQLLMDTLVPFVKTISVVSRDGNWNLTESLADTNFLEYLGTNAQFFPDRSQVLPEEGGIIRLDHLTQRTRVGYVMGGIHSPDPNISDTDPTFSSASGRVFGIYITPNVQSSISLMVKPPLLLEVSPNPFQEQVQVEIRCDATDWLKADILDSHGNVMDVLWDGPGKTEMN